MAKVKRAHIVPQVYLRSFRNKQEQIWTFDKLQQRAWSTNIINVAVEKAFYDISSEYLQEGVDVQVIERWLRDQHENAIASIFPQVFEELGNNRRFPVEFRTELARIVAIQFLRSSDFRSFLEGALPFFATHLNQVDNTNFPYDPNALSAHHGSFMVEFVDPTAAILNQHIWYVGVNETNEPLYTSDVPVVRKPHGPNVGFNSEGMELAFPLSPRYLLILRERKHFAARCDSWDNTVRALSSDKVRDYNELQIKQSRRQIYCSSNRFQQVEKLCRLYPALTRPAGSRMRIRPSFSQPACPANQAHVAKQNTARRRNKPR